MPRCNGADKVKVCQESDCVESALRSENVMSNGFVFPGTAGVLMSVSLRDQKKSRSK